MGFVGWWRRLGGDSRDEIVAIFFFWAIGCDYEQEEKSEWGSKAEWKSEGGKRAQTEEASISLSHYLAGILVQGISPAGEIWLNFFFFCSKSKLLY